MYSALFALSSPWVPVELAYAAEIEQAPPTDAIIAIECSLDME